MAIIKSGGRRQRMIERARRLLRGKKPAENVSSAGGAGGSEGRAGGVGRGR